MLKRSNEASLFLALWIACLVLQLRMYRRHPVGREDDSDEGLEFFDCGFVLGDKCTYFRTTFISMSNLDAAFVAIFRRGILSEHTFISLRSYVCVIFQLFQLTYQQESGINSQEIMNYVTAILID
ncbi:hypothetical protein VNO80_11502 [Phaseolus coccineus]|uniref:Uncharacterized protein n=1 Tax=Phaseolus coccineus TaxID=3886 RepID=A0AAN9NFG0_PHACN